MQKRPLFPSALALALAALFFALPSCRKVYDFIHDHPDARDTLCRITTISTVGYFGNHDVYTVTYNTKGNPISMLDASPVGTSGNIDQYFRYDRFNRLSDYMWTFIGAKGGVVAWHKYAYPRKNFVTDTTISYIDVNVDTGASPIAASLDYYTITGYTLDAHERIWKIWSIPNDPLQPPVLQTTISYDANGNLPLSDSTLAYDNKVNIYRTNKTWQFVYNNYSRNNVIKPGLFEPLPTYNDFGLPLTLPNLTSNNIYYFLLVNSGPPMQITYACSAPKGPVSY